MKVMKFFPKTSLKTDISHTLMRKAPKKPFKFLKNPDFLNISLDAPKGLWRFLEVSGGSSRLLEAPRPWSPSSGP